MYKKAINLSVIEKSEQQTTSSVSDFEKYFKNTDLFELFKFDPKTCCEKCDTLEMLLEQDGFPIVETPTNDKHIAYLRTLKNIVHGITLASNLYTQKEKIKPVEQSFGFEKQEITGGSRRTRQMFNT